MKKKINYKKENKDLKIQLEHNIKTANDYYDSWKTWERKYNDKFEDKMKLFESSNCEYIHTIETLREIIRWHINPETARTPFSPLFKDGDKSNSLDNRGRYN